MSAAAAAAIPIPPAGKSRRAPVVEETEEEIALQAGQRRLLRQDLRALESEICVAEQRKETCDMGTFEAYRGRANNLFGKVTHVREALQDAEVLRNLSNRVLKGKASKIADLQTRYDYDTFALAVRERFEIGRRMQGGGRGSSSGDAFSAANAYGGVFSWTRLGTDVGSLFLFTPSCNTLLGPITKEEKPRKESTRKVKEDLGPVQKPMELSNPAHKAGEQEDGDELNEATTQRIGQLLKCIEQTSGDVGKETAGADTNIDLMAILVDPDDSVQTVENFFDYSFLIKDKKVKIDFPAGARGGGSSSSSGGASAAAKGKLAPSLPDIVPIPEVADTKQMQKRQMVLTLGMKDVSRIGKMMALLENAGTGGDKNRRNSKSFRESISSDSGNSSSAFMSQNPLHRDDPLYREKDAVHQSQILEEYKKKKLRAVTRTTSGSGGGNGPKSPSRTTSGAVESPGNNKRKRS